MDFTTYRVRRTRERLGGSGAAVIRDGAGCGATTPTNAVFGCRYIVRLGMLVEMSKDKTKFMLLTIIKWVTTRGRIAYYSKFDVSTGHLTRTLVWKRQYNIFCFKCPWCVRQYIVPPILSVTEFNTHRVSTSNNSAGYGGNISCIPCMNAYLFIDVYYWRESLGC